MSVSLLRGVQGLVLHVEEYGEQPPETLTYHKSQSRTIVIGRKSSQGNPEQPDPERALFRCPVVYITDLGSHHGTHILRPGELVSTSLKREVPTVVADGDLITFGKTVGRDTNLVRPVVARVELTFGGDASKQASPPPPRSLAVERPITPGPAADDSPSQSQPHERDGEKTPTRTNTGRYGVFLPSPESSASSSSDSDSDVQEISPPPSPPRNVLTSLPSSSSPFASLGPFGCPVIPLGARLRLLQQILPPIHIAESPEPDYYPPPIEPFSFEEILVEGGVVEEEEEEDMDLSSSRAHSPAHNDELHEEPPVVGAWPHSPSRASESPSEPRESSVESQPTPHGRREVIEISDDDYGTPVPDIAVSAPVEGNEAVRPIEESPEADVEMVDMVFGDAESAASPPEDLPSLPEDDVILDLGNANANESAASRLFANVTLPLEPANASVTFDTSAIEAQIAEARDEINTIRTTRDADEVIFTAHVEQTKARLDALDVRMQDTQSNLTSRDDELSTIDTRLQTLRSIVSGLQERNDLGERLEELMEEVGKAKDMLHETCALHEQAREQMAEELETVKALRVEAAATVAEAKLASAAAQAAASEASKSLKRKRDDDAEDGDSVPPNLTHMQDLQVARQPLSKRRRTLRVVAKVAQTATVASLGAVAAWTALAFS
ncbi:hypothetical protein GSI_05140 [Ganoderma sinense ZZ0214-1]|uniref:FHA domain-containing protein n=1 Tax=Ganoderma sinense ZZ0214-1 TaxID=1077348 RepID=A0A2G8SFS2_9APHY|nr:hypothetical protein GSI_05140 [Ganoderma sinense ZZ0214-1]